MTDLTHFDAEGRARMVDVSAKPPTRRQARAEARIRMEPATLERIKAGTLAKGDVLGVARLAGIMAAKRTSDLIPLCHPIALSSVEVGFVLNDANGPAVKIEADVRCTGPTGVEMEAMTAASVAALTIYDMCKSVDRAMTVEAVRLVYKAGGKSGTYEAAP